MSETQSGPEDPRRRPAEGPPEPLPAAVVKTGGTLSLVWLVPLVALVIGAWLAFKTFTEKGPTIRIEFKTAAGLAAGQTKVKFKDVEVGQVTAIDVGGDLERVIVTAELKHAFAEFLTENTRFWVERPRVTASGVSGLDTLLSGAYIALDPGAKGRSRRDFQGLETPPLIITAEPGSYMVLRAPTLGSLNIGSPVYYRRIQVGQVVGYSLDADGRAVRVEVFVSAPHDDLVSGNTRFWNASGIDVSFTAAGITLDTESLLAVLIGGVSFDTPDTIASGRSSGRLPEVFPLYPSREEAYAKIYSRKQRYLLFFKGAVRGLAIGAPVMLKGIELGKVLDIQLQFSPEHTEFHIPVLIEIEPDRIAVRGEIDELHEAGMVERLVDAGLRGQLKTGSLLTGELYVDLDFHPESPPEMVATYGGYEVIPTIPTPLEAMTTKITQILDELDAIPLDRIGQDLSATLASTKALVSSAELEQAIHELKEALAGVRVTTSTLNDRIAPELSETLRQSSATLETAQALISDRSPLYIEMQRMFQEVGSAARSVRIMADYLERHPEALLQGKGRGR